MSAFYEVYDVFTETTEELTAQLKQLSDLLDKERKAVISVNDAVLLEIAEQKLKFLNKINELKKRKKEIEVQSGKVLEYGDEVSELLEHVKSKLIYNRKLLIRLYKLMGGLFEQLNNALGESETYDITGRKPEKGKGGVLKTTWG